MSTSLLRIINVVTLIATLYINYLGGSGQLGSETMASMSAKYPTLITPAAPAFAIWGFIYLLLIGFMGFQFSASGEKFTSKTGPWFALSNVFNSAWILFWLNDQVPLATLMMIALLITLIVLSVKLDLELYDEPVRVILFVWWPICIYLGWIVLATAVNLAAFGVSLGWQGEPLAPADWSVLILVTAVLIYLFLTFNRNMRETNLVGIWGLGFIAYRFWNENDTVVYTSLVLAFILFIAASYHGFRNMETSPLKKLQRGEF